MRFSKDFEYDLSELKVLEALEKMILPHLKKEQLYSYLFTEVLQDFKVGDWITIGEPLLEEFKLYFPEKFQPPRAINKIKRAGTLFGIPTIFDASLEMQAVHYKSAPEPIESNNELN